MSNNFIKNCPDFVDTSDARTVGYFLFV